MCLILIPILQVVPLTILGSSLRGSMSPHQAHRSKPSATITLDPASDRQPDWNKTSTASIDRQSWEARTGAPAGGGNLPLYTTYHGEFKPYQTHKTTRPQTAPLQRRTEGAASEFNTTSTAMGGYDVRSWNARMESGAPAGFTYGSISPNTTKRSNGPYQTIELKPAAAKFSPINDVAAWCKRLNDISVETRRGNVSAARTSSLVMRPSTAQPTRRTVQQESPFNTSSTQAIDVQSWIKRQEMRA